MTAVPPPAVPPSPAEAAAHALEAMLHGPVGGRGAIEVAYQPIVDLDRGVVAGYEALARFPEPARSPLPWFELARRVGSHDALEAAALRAALAARTRLPPNTFLTVNLGPDVLAAPVVEQVWRAESSLDGVVVELTENVRVESFSALAPALDDLRSRGALLAIDDAGAGYAGLQHFLTLRPDFIKLDRSLIEGVDRNEAKRALVEMMGTFASRIDAWLLAEGIETRAELDVLLHLGVPLGQGYLLGRPARSFMPLAADLADVLGSPRSDPRDAETLRPFLEQVPIVLEAGQLADAFAHQPVDLIVALDEHGRPVATVDAAGDITQVRAGLRVNLDTPVTQAVQRALVRPEKVRFQPLVCVDDAGRYVGVVRMERLVDRLCRPDDDTPTDAAPASGAH